MYQVMRKLNVSSKIALAATTTLLLNIANSYAADAVKQYDLGNPSDNLGYSWTGFYLGGQIGYGLGKSDISYHDNYYNLAYPFSYDTSGFKGGAYAGYNFNLTNNMIFGVEADFMYSDIGSDQSDDTYLKGDNGEDVLNRVDRSIKEKWSGATRARLGFANGRYLPYIAGGLAYAKMETYSLATSQTQSFDYATSNTMMGWTAGAGLDYAWNDHFSLRLEYRYNDYGDKKYTMPDGDYTDAYSTKFTTNEVRLGVGYKF